MRRPRKSQWLRVTSKLLGRCWYCGDKPPEEEITVDHVKPQSKGGQNHDDNLLPACKYCNTLKSDLSISGFRKWCKVRVIRNQISLGYASGDLRKIKIIFYGEGNSSPLGW